MESGIINFVGFSCTGGVLLIWAKETFGRDVEEDEEKEGLLSRLYSYINNIFHRIFPVGEVIEDYDYEEEETEQEWKAYVRHQESHGKYKVNI